MFVISLGLNRTPVLSVDLTVSTHSVVRLINVRWMIWPPIEDVEGVREVTLLLRYNR